MELKTGAQGNCMSTEHSYALPSPHRPLMSIVSMVGPKGLPTGTIDTDHIWDYFRIKNTAINTNN